MNKSVYLIALVVAGSAALSQAPAEGQSVRRGHSQDPNEVVCIRERELGSRLATRRVCRTRAEWEEHHRQARQAVEKAQYDKPTNF